MAAPEIQADPGAPLGSPTSAPASTWQPPSWDDDKPQASAPVPTSHPEFDPTPAEAATLAHIRHNESGSSEGDYGLLHGPGGQHVHDLSAFPEWEGFQGPAGISHAAGAYGFEPATYSAMAQKTGYQDFSPQSQDANALALLRRYGANSSASWQASGPYQEPGEGRPVPMPVSSPPRQSGPQNQGPFSNRFDAYDAAPRDQQNYMLLQQDNKWQWVPKSQVPDNGTGPSPYYSEDTDKKIANDALLNGPHSQKHSLGTAITDFARGFNSQIAGLLDIPAHLADAGMGALAAGTGISRDSLPHFGTPVANLANKLGVETDKQGEGWASTMGYGLGSGLGATLPMVAGGVGVGGLAAKATGINMQSPLSSAVNELLLGSGSGEVQQEMHELYKSQTGREGDLGDLATQMIAGGVANMARVGAVTAVEKAWQGGSKARAVAADAARAAMGQDPSAARPNTPEVQQTRSALGYDPHTPLDTGPQPLDAKTGKQITDQVLSEQLNRKLDIAKGHVEALGTALPEDSAAVLAEHSSAAKEAVNSFLKSSRSDEQKLWSPESGVNLDMPRDFSATKSQLEQMKADHFDPSRIRDPESWPTAGEKLLSQLGTSDTLGRGQDIRSRLGQQIEDEMAVQGRAQDSSKIGYLQRLRNSLGEDLQRGGEGVDPNEIDAYRRAMAASASRAQIVESPEMQAFLKAGDSTALEKLVKQGPGGVDAAKVLLGAAQAKYGSNGLLSAAEDAIRQKYSDAVAPHGYVSLADHDRFMQRYGGILETPEFANVKNQLETARNSEADVNNTIGYGRPGGFGKSGSALDIRNARAETYLNAPTKTVLDHLEGVSDQFSATRKALAQTDADPTGAASLGLQHNIAERALYQPRWMENNQGMVEAIDRINPGFSQRLTQLTTPSTVGGIARKLIEVAPAYVGAQVGGHMAQHTGSSFVMAGRMSNIFTSIVKNGLEKLTGLSTALAVDPNAAQAWGRTITGQDAKGLATSAAQRAADLLVLHAYVPGFILMNSPIGQTNPQTGTGQMGSAPNKAGPPSMQGPGGQPWYKSLPSYGGQNG